MQAGGVTSVIRDAAAAVMLCMPELSGIVLISGRAAEMVSMRERIRERVAMFGDATGGTVGEANERVRDDSFIRVAVHPDLDYRRPDAALRSRIVALLNSYRGDDAVWWLHNHQLGKNPAFTAAVADVVRCAPRQRIILQIHDFPECARYDNLMALQAMDDIHCYPQQRSVAYATINHRDYRLLRRAGIANTHLLPNPLFAAAPPVVGRVELRRRLAELGREGGSGGFDPDAPIVLCPVRAIRRKNLWEAALIAALAAQGGRRVNLIITVPGISEAERGYSDRLAEAYQSGLIPGLWGIGNRLHRVDLGYEDLLGGADLVLSSSVQEGFGFAFFESVMAGRPLIARHLDGLNGFDRLLAPAHPHFYRSLLIPTHCFPFRRWKQELYERYRAAIGRVEAVCAHAPDVCGGRSADASGGCRFFLPDRSDADRSAEGAPCGGGGNCCAQSPAGSRGRPRACRCDACGFIPIGFVRLDFVPFGRPAAPLCAIRPCTLRSTVARGRCSSFVRSSRCIGAALHERADRSAGAAASFCHAGSLPTVAAVALCPSDYIDY